MDALLELLSEDFKINPTQLEKAVTFVKKQGGRLEKVLISLGALSTDQLPLLYSKWLKLPLALSFELDEQILQHSYSFDTSPLLALNWFPVSVEGNTLHFLVVDPLESAALEYLAYHQVSYSLTISSEDVIEALKSKLLFAGKQLEGHFGNDSDTEKLLELASEAPIINLVNNLIYRGVKQGASDMHIETDSLRGRVRYRIDGVLQDADLISRNMTLPAITRIKILSAMDIAERRRPQDGKIESNINGEVIDIRVSILPRNEGESVVMRFLRQEALKPVMADLGMPADIEQAIKADLQKTSGVILMTGPTGSGKTTTLYTFLHHLNQPQVKIITLEDPIEYQLDGVSQVQVQPDIGFDFAAGLRSVVRQDPDIIMVGEIRDKETASIAMQSALTGHLVFSTVHTNDAPSAYSRLLDLGVDEFLLNAALQTIIAQRLARKLCPHCKEPEPDQAALVSKYQLDDLATNSQVPAITLMKAKGCEHCNHTGYKGRTAVMEYLRCDDEIMAIPKDEHFILNARKVMRQRGERSLIQDGLLKAIKGETTIAEVFRVAG